MQDKKTLQLMQQLSNQQATTSRVKSNSAMVMQGLGLKTMVADPFARLEDDPLARSAKEDVEKDQKWETLASRYGKTTNTPLEILSQKVTTQRDPSNNSPKLSNKNASKSD